MANIRTTGKASSISSKQEIWQIREKKGQKDAHEIVRKNIGLIAGGTGITPVYQLLNAVYEF